MDEITRPQTAAEKRYLRALRTLVWRTLRRMLPVYSIAPLGLLFLLFMQSDWTWQRMPPLLTLALLAAVPLFPFLITLPFQIELRRINAAIASGLGKELRIRASAVVAFEATKIKPVMHQAFALQTGSDEILFLNDHAIEVSAHFPNTDFSLVSLSRGPVGTGMVIVKRGAKLTPLRCLPPDAFQRPPHLSRAKGSLENLETILDEWPRDRLV